MNMQDMLKKAQQMQKDMMKTQEEINNKIYEGKSSLVTVELTGDKRIKKININADEIEKDEVEMFEDMIVVAINDAMSKIDRETEEKMGKYTQGMPGIF